MRILVTAETIRLRRPMLLTVARSALGHQCIVIVFARVIGVKDLMALLAGKSMFAAGLLQICKLAGMALAAFHGLQRRRRSGVELCVNLWEPALGGKNEPWLGKPSQGGNKHQGA